VIEGRARRVDRIWEPWEAISGMLCKT